MVYLEEVKVKKIMSRLAIGWWNQSCFKHYLQQSKKLLAHGKIVILPTHSNMSVNTIMDNFGSRSCHLLDQPNKTGQSKYKIIL